MTVEPKQVLLGAWVAALMLLGAAAPVPQATAVEPRDCWPGRPGTDPRDCPPNDPEFGRHWEFLSEIPEKIDRSRMHPSEAALGSIGFSLDTAWQHTTGRSDVVIAVLDSGIRWRHRDLRLKLYLNRGELPPPEGSERHDRNSDGVFNVLDYEGDTRVADLNGNGLIDAEDLIRTFSDCVDDDGNGYPDDISGYDFFSGTHCDFAAGDNNPADDAEFGHGTGIASTAAAQTNNGLEDAGVCPNCSVLPVRVGDSFVVDANRFARGVVFATRSGADVIASALGSYNNTPAARAATDFAYAAGVPIVASAADEYSYHHNYPSVYNHTVYVNAVRHDDRDYEDASTFWSINGCTNYGARVWITVPAKSCSSGATSRLSGVVGLIESAARDAGLGGLHAEEVYQVLRATADDLDNRDPDWGELRWPARAGFDQYSGYGRLNARRAVRAVIDGEIPPIVDLDGPRWFAIVSPRSSPSVNVSGTIRLPRAGRASYRLGYALGVEPAEDEFHLLAEGVVEDELVGNLGVLNFERLPLPRGPAPVDRNGRDRFSVTLLLRVVDERGRVGEARRSFFVHDDPSAKPGFPVDLAVSGEASPLVADLDSDGRDEIVLATSDGYVTIWRVEPGGLRSERFALDALPLVDPVTREVWRETIVRGPVLGDLNGDGRKSLVVASRSGKVYAFSTSGERIGSFPVAIDPTRAQPTGKHRRVESGVLSAPVLADLDGRPGLEIVVSSMDGHLYAWRHDATLLDGFPVRLRDARTPDAAARTISTPAVGDIDGDGRPEIVVGSNANRDGLVGVYAVRADGREHADGPLVSGWDPFEIPALRPSLLPTLGSGVAMSPILVDRDGDGDVEALIFAVTGDAIVLVDQPHGAPPAIVARYSMEPQADSGFNGISFLPGTGSPLVADTNHDGRREIYAPLLPMRMVTLRTKPGTTLDVPLALGGWPLEGEGEPGSAVPMLPSWPRRMEDMMILARPIAADTDDDGVLEVLMGSGGYLLHAFRADGSEAAGFPKFTGGWIFSAPAVGDLDGDGRRELVSVTREGYLFAWELGAGPPAPPPGR